MINIITAKKEDLETISDMAFQLMQHHEKIDQFYSVVLNAKEIWKAYVSDKISDKNTRIAIAKKDDTKIIGYALSHIISRPSIYKVNSMGDVSDCFVLPEYRGSPAAVKLINDAINWFISKGIRYIGGQVERRNERSAKLWQKLGYQPYILKLMRDYYE